MTVGRLPSGHMSGAPPPSWYPDPSDAARLRWWDGSQWTEHLHPLVPAEPVDRDLGTEPTEPQQLAVIPDHSVEPVAPTSTSPVPVPMSLPGPGAPPARDRTPMIVGGGIVAVLLIGVIAFALSRGGRRRRRRPVTNDSHDRDDGDRHHDRVTIDDATAGPDHGGARGLDLQ